VVLFRVGGDGDGADHEKDYEGRAIDETVVGLRDPEPDTGEQDVVPAPPAPEPRQPAPRAATQSRRPRRTFKRVLVTLLVLALLAGAVVGAVAVIRSVYFVGQDDRGLVTLYRGVPYELPLGIDLYEPEYVSSVPARTLSPTQRRRQLDHQLRSREDAADIVRELERGRL
jgi:PPM family protein phosphatase